MKNLLLPLVTLLLASSPAAHAHGDHDHAEAKQSKASADPTAFGRAGDPAQVDRTINVTMNDQMRFEPSAITVRQGETVRFRLTNRGAVLHEMVLGTESELKKHAELMRKFPDMEHDDAHMAHVKPGTNGEIVWTFDKKGEFGFACLIPGHFEAGMIGKVVVR
jgi:uncharacterized cupredoxin-like copper-binding protein